MRVRFHQWELDLDCGELAFSGEPVRLQPQPAKVLALLARRAGTLVLREEIQRELWHRQSQVDFDQGLNYCIRQIRVVLKDNAEEPTYIETVPRKGYRFRVPVAPVDSGESSNPETPAAAPPSQKQAMVRLAWMVPLCAVVLAVLTTVFVLRITSKPAAVASYSEITHDGLDNAARP